MLSLAMSAMCQTTTQMKTKTVLKENKSKKAKSKGLVEFDLYGTDMQVRFDASKRVKVKYGDNNKVADCIEWLNSVTDETLQDCLKLRKELNLCDWAYVKMLDKLSSASLGNTNEAIVMMTVLLNRSGYETRLAWGKIKM